MLFLLIPVFLTLLSSTMSTDKEGKDILLAKATPTTPKDKGLLIKGSIPYWDQPNAFSSFQEHIVLFDYVNLFWYYLGKEGEVVKYDYTIEDRSIIEYAHKHNVKISAVIANLPEFSAATWDSKRVEDIVFDDKRRQSHIQNIIVKLKDLNFDGIIIDYESVQPVARVAFSRFIQELSIALHKENKILSVVLHPKTGERVAGEENAWFQEWKTLAKYSDQLQIMAYNEHWDESDAGPVASTPWTKRIIEYARRQNIPSEKLFLGIPLYGYDWNKKDESSAVGLTFSEAQRLMSEYNAEVKWDGQDQSPYFTYERRGDTHEVWFENAKSVAEKTKLAKNAGFAGITFWRLGGEDPEVWKEVESHK